MEATSPPHAGPAPKLPVPNYDDEFPSISLEAAMKQEVTHAERYEQQLTALERSLAFGLKEIREKVALYKEMKLTVQDHIRLAKQLEAHNVPGIGRAGARTREVVHDVEWKLPGIRSQLVEIRKVYDLGQRRAQILQAEMEWKAKTDFQQWRSTLLGRGPLSPEQVKREWARLIWRVFFAVAMIIFMYFSCTTLRRH